MLTVKLQGGLGNQLFQLATGECISVQTNKRFYLQCLDSPKTIHSTQNYFNTIFKTWKSFLNVNTKSKSKTIQENPYMQPEMWNKRVSGYSNIILEGYFQNYKYIEPIYNQFVSKLSFDETILSKYTDICDSVFVHIRGGDYVNSKFHELDLKEYYKKSFELFDKEKFYVFTNDKEYSSQFLNDIDYTYVDENEIDSLFLMTKCKGGICANSSFSWWAAYLNKNRKLIMPSKWYNDQKMYIDGYYFDGIIKINVD